MFNPTDLLRPHLKQLVPYSSARDDYKGKDGVFLDAKQKIQNENSDDSAIVFTGYV